MDVTGPKGRWPKPEPGSGVEDATPLILEWLGEQRVDAMVRVDAEGMRSGQPPWTFTASGGHMPHAMRADGASVGECMNKALVQLRAAGLAVPF